MSVALGGELSHLLGLVRDTVSATKLEHGRLEQLESTGLRPQAASPDAGVEVVVAAEVSPLYLGLEGEWLRTARGPPGDCRSP